MMAALPKSSGPGCGWVMAYIETLLHSYPSLDLTTIRLRLPLAAGLQLLEARACRLAPDTTVSHVEKQIIASRAAVRAWYEDRFDIVPTPPRSREDPA